ncbi:MAG: protein kinase [Candidatus Hydrogenedentes bacterium]|nr:protein kinase [Candidatus Hydrogenedentota bacterium]
MSDVEVNPGKLAKAPRDHASTLDWRPGDVVMGVYEVRDLLGEGGMGKVFRVWHRGWHSEVAVKVPKPDGLLSAEGYADFENECELWTGLGWHPHVISCHFVRRFSGIPIVFVELAEKGSISKWIASGKLYRGSEALVLRRVLNIALQSALGLGHAHEHGLVHGDVKPGNILLTAKGAAKITDFGLARTFKATGDSASGGRTSAASTAMTPAYCSPEQARGATLTANSDMWSWAVSVIEMFVGEVRWVSGQLAPYVLDQYFSGASASGGTHGESEAASPPLRVPHPPREIIDLLRDCLRDEPSARPHGMGEVANRLRSFCEATYGKSYLAAGVHEQPERRRIYELATLNNRAVSLIELGDAQAAENLLRQGFLKTQSASGPVLSDCVQSIAFNLCRLQIRRLPKIECESIRNLIPAGENPTRQRLLVAMLFLETGRIEDALTTLDDVIADDSPWMTDALNLRGIGFLLIGETRPALACFTKAALRSPERLDIWRNLGLACYYDGKSAAALDLFEDLAVKSLLDADDAIRFAVLLSAGGLHKHAARWTWQAVSSERPSSSVFLTAAELTVGAQTFLPWVCPVAPGIEVRKSWVDQVVSEEPENLRARVDKETLPSRFGLKTGPVIRGRRRVLVRTGRVSQVAGNIVSSFSVLTRRRRWGSVPGFVRPALIVLLSGLPAAATALSASMFMAEGRAVNWTALIAFFVAWLLTLRGAPSNRLTVEVLRLAPFACVPVLVMNSPASGHVGPVTAAVLLSSIPVTLATFAVWQIFLQRMSCLARAFPKSCGPLDLLNPVRLFERVPRMPDTSSLIAKNEATLHRRIRIELSLPAKLGARLSRSLNNLPPAITKSIQNGLSAFLGWQIFLTPQLLVLFYLMQFADAENPATKYLPFLATPMLLAVFSPWLTLTLNIPASVYTAVQASRVFLDKHATLVGMGDSFASTVPIETQRLILAVVAGLVFLLLSWCAFRNCSEFIPEWKTCDPSPWDIRQIIDPLDIRRYAAPWQLVQPEETTPVDAQDAATARHHKAEQKNVARQGTSANPGKSSTGGPSDSF